MHILDANLAVPNLTSIILTSTLIATVLSTIANYVISVKVKRIDFENDYRKYILEKRKKAYDILENIINEYSEMIVIKEGAPSRKSFVSPTIFYITPQKRKPVAEFLVLLGTTAKYKFWYSESMYKKLIEVNTFLHRVNVQADNVKSDAEYQLLNWKDILKEYENHKIELNRHFFDDLKNLSNIKDFKKNKTHNLLRLSQLEN